MKKKLTDFTLQIPDAEGKIVRRVKVKVPVEWDEAVGEWMMTPEALRMVEDAKAREMGIIMPDEMKSLRKRFGLTQAQMGALFQVGGKSWTRWESGKYRPSRVISLLIRAVAGGHLPLAYLRGEAGLRTTEIDGGAKTMAVRNENKKLLENKRTEFWRSLLVDNPAMRAPVIRFTPQALKEFFHTVWNCAYALGARTLPAKARAISTDTTKPPRSSGRQDLSRGKAAWKDDKDSIWNDLLKAVPSISHGTPCITSVHLREFFDTLWGLAFLAGCRDITGRKLEIIEARLEKCLAERRGHATAHRQASPPKVLSAAAIRQSGAFLLLASA